MLVTVNPPPHPFIIRTTSLLSAEVTLACSRGENVVTDVTVMRKKLWKASRFWEKSKRQMTLEFSESKPIHWNGNVREHAAPSQL
jgi:hypothetical protein